MKTLFIEKQKFTQWWLWGGLIALFVASLFAFYKQIIVHEPLGDNPAPNSLIYTSLIIFFLLVALFYTIELRTNINKDFIQVQFFPFVKKDIKWHEIETVKVVNYGFVGGWGIRLWTKYGTVYNIKGKIGLAIELKNGKKLLIGTQKETELKAFIEKGHN